MIRTFYFVGGAVSAIALSNFLGTLSRAFPGLRVAMVILLCSLILLGLVAALTHEEQEETLPIWFVFLLAVLGGIGIAFI